MCKCKDGKFNCNQCRDCPVSVGMSRAEAWSLLGCVLAPWAVGLGMGLLAAGMRL